MEKIRNFFRFKNKYLEKAFIMLLITGLSFLVMTLTFVFSSATWNMDLFNSYFQSELLLFMNLIPIIIFMTVFYLIVNRIWLSFLIASFFFVLMSMANKFKLYYRDEPFWFIDIRLIRESMDMGQKYSITLSRNMIIIFIGLIFITIVLKLFMDYRQESKKARIIMLMSVLLVSYVIFSGPYFNSKVYADLGDKSLINIWSQSQQYQSKGFVYPFLYSITQVLDPEIEGYDEEKAIKDLAKYDYKDIAEERKVHVISIMLEAYSDFSEFDTIDFKRDPYEYFHKLQKESISGNLVTNIFGGGTIDTERAFLTGYYNLPTFVSPTNSFLWYLKDQGYVTEAMHPIYGWFYNRRNINSYLGFDSFDYYENKYSQVSEEYLQDIDFFDYIIEGYEGNKENPYFNFSVTYQNHGPYDENYYEENQFVIRQDNYDDKTINMFNNYLAGINRTDEAIEKLIEFFKSEDEPVIVVLFGDHKPWLGNNDIAYKMMDINMDFSNEEGFLNYYKTPFIIWGNDVAKSILESDLVGEVNDISPNFLMAELFNALGWEGNDYMQYIQDLKNHYDVNHKVYFKENGEYTTELSPENKKRYEEFLNAEYYHSHNYKNKTD
ncbi:LTA synthase family protein [Tissierella creatinini]|nr:LTA synthase family protein [Tissierella creatinini]TJX65090.1 LTA synthase family protein [Soehngenia saccharolytica]